MPTLMKHSQFQFMFSCSPPSEAWEGNKFSGLRCNFCWAVPRHRTPYLLPCYINDDTLILMYSEDEGFFLLTVRRCISPLSPYILNKSKMNAQTQSHSCHKHITYVFHILSFCSLLLTARTDVPQLRKAVVKKVVANIIILCVCVWTALNEKKSLYYNFIITKNVNFCISKLLMSSKLNTKYNS